MAYNVIWHESARQSLLKLDKSIAAKIYRKVNDYLVQDPVGLGKKLTADLSGLYRYRYGDYRVIYRIDEGDITIAVITVDHRRKVYH